MAVVSSSTRLGISTTPYHPSASFRRLLRPTATSQLCTPPPPHRRIDRASVAIAETTAEGELRAAACLRTRSFHEFPPSTFGIQEHRKFLAERELEALKERVAGKRVGFWTVSCINATIPLSQLDSSSAAQELSLECKYSGNGEERVVVGTLDLNQCVRLPDEITGKRPEVIGDDFARAYLSNVCVAKELQRNGIAKELVEKSKLVAAEWGISDLYVHVAVDNEPAINLYTKCGFVYESDEPAWQARFLERPRRLLLWFGLP